MNEKEIAIDYILKNPSLASWMILTKRQLTVYEYCLRKKEILSRDVTKFFKISIQNSNAVLCSLYKKGYLSRYKVAQESGGYEWLYETKIVVDKLNSGLRK